MSRLIRLPFAQLTRFADVYRSNGDLSPLPGDGGSKDRKEIATRATRVLLQMQQEFGLMTGAEVADHGVRYRASRSGAELGSRG